MTEKTHKWRCRQVDDWIFTISNAHNISTHEVKDFANEGERDDFERKVEDEEKARIQKLQ